MSSLSTLAAAPLSSPRFLRDAARTVASIPTTLTDAVREFRERSNSQGALLLHNLPIGDVPPTPLTNDVSTKTDRTSEHTLLGVASLLGEPVGYAQEHGGDIVQNLFPLRSSVGRQVSTSSGVALAFHTETAFHPAKPHYLLLLCLRGDDNAATTLCGVDAIVEALDPKIVDVLSQPRFRTGVDESFGEGSSWLTPPMPVLVSRPNHRGHVLTFDADLMIGMDSEAADALDEVTRAITSQHTSVTLRTGDLLIVDNHRAVHGRSPFTARFDGTDRWLQRTFVVDLLPPSASAPRHQRRTRVVRTRFV